VTGRDARGELAEVQPVPDGSGATDPDADELPLQMVVVATMSLALAQPVPSGCAQICRIV